VKVLVTGATGFVGSHTATALAAAGHRIRVLARSRTKAEALLARLQVRSEDLVVGDMTDPAAVAQALEGCEGLVHCAAAVSVTQAGGDDAFSANELGARCVIGEACRRALPSMLFVSSLTAVYDPRAPGLEPGLPIVRSRTRYGQSKAASERFVREQQEAGAPIHIVYPSGVVGADDPGQSESMRAHVGFLRQTIRAGGTQFVEVRDLAVLHARLLERPGAERVIAAGHYFSWDDLTLLFEEVSGAKIPRVALPGWLLRGMGSAADLARAWTGRSFGPFTREALEIATLWQRVPDSPLVAELGVRWRDARETVEAVLRWGLANGRVRPAAAPRLVALGAPAAAPQRTGS
jgi:nucleoside-diphosphate-sugar epimerase